MAYKTPKERMKISLRREEVELTGKPFYLNYEDVPGGLFSPTKCKQMKRPVEDGEEPVAYVLNRMYLGYLPLYKR